MTVDDEGNVTSDQSTALVGLHGSCVVVRLVGQVGAQHSSLLRTIFAEAIPTRTPPRMIIDFSETMDCDKSVIAELARVVRQVGALGGTTALASIPAGLRGPLSHNGEFRTAKVYENAYEAIEELSPRP